MTKESKIIALKKESKARWIIAELGLCKSLKGTHIIKELITGKKSAERLSELDIEQIMDSWESRYCVPISLIDQKNVDNIKFVEEKEETKKDYNRRKVILIDEYIKTICG